MFVRNPLLFQMTFTVSFKTLRFFSSGPSRLCYSTRLLRQQQYVLLQRHNISVHLNSSLNGPDPLLSCCLCFTQYVLGKKIDTTSAVKVSTQSFDRNLCHSAPVSGLIQSSSSFSARARYSESVSISNFSNLFRSQNLVKKL